MLNTNKNIHCIPSTPCIECKCDPCVCYLSICDYYSALENETLYFEHLFQYYNNRVIISSENKPLNFIKGSDMHLHSITGTCSTKDNGVESHNQSVSNFDDKASDNPDIP
jgi:hypothetical protein